MSTNNFAYENCLQVIEVGDDPFVVEETKFNITTNLQLKWPNGSVVDRHETNGNRSYPGIAIFEYELTTRQNYHAFTIEVVIRSGYYADANVDWKVIDGADAYQLSQKQYDYYMALANNVGKNMERIIKKYTTRLHHVATFSNGEALYTR